MRLTFVLAATLALAGCAAAIAQERRTDVQQLYNDCKSPRGSFENTLCIGYVVGVGQQMFYAGETFRGLRKNEPKDNGRAIATLFLLSACSQSSVSNGAMVQAFVNWAARHPERWTDKRQIGVWEAIQNTWPCLEH